MCAGKDEKTDKYVWPTHFEDGNLIQIKILHAVLHNSQEKEERDIVLSFVHLDMEEH